jgi:Uma2 family endonuclease
MIKLNQVNHKNVSNSAMKTLAKWSIDDYHQMIEAGILHGRHLELLGGKIVEMSPETPIHYTTAKQGTKYLEELLSGKADVRFNGPITLSDSEPEPDIAIVRLPESSYNDRHPGPQDIFWIVEVAKTSLKKDLEIKLAIYATAGIQEYWVLDLSTKQVIVFRNPQGDNYVEEYTMAEGTIAPLAFADVSVSVKRLLP